MPLCGESYTGALQIFDLTGQVQLTASTATRARKVKMTMGKKINYVDMYAPLRYFIACNSCHEFVRRSHARILHSHEWSRDKAM